MEDGKIVTLFENRTASMEEIIQEKMGVMTRIENEVREEIGRQPSE